MKTTTSCRRLFEVEAMRDGRLGEQERARFERHLSACPECLREFQTLQRLAESVRAASVKTDSNSDDELHVRRERTRLLAAFDRSLVTSERQSSNRRWWLLWPAAAAAAAAFMVIFVVFGRGWPPATRPMQQSPGALVRADSSAVWSKTLDGDSEKVVLERGVLWVHVDHGPRKARLVVLLPDGELEDLGTTFTVSAEDGHTTRVAVQEGSIVLRLRGKPPVAVAAGEEWVPQVPQAASPACPSAAPPPPAPGAPERTTPAAPAPRSIVAVAAPESSNDFRAALAALDDGDNLEAAAAFATFGLKYPMDPKAEDAAYLRVIALQRSGDDSSMREAAREYLLRYPAGFRRAEVERLSQ